MKKILVLGAGLVSKPLVTYLLNVEDFFVTLGDMDADRAGQMVAGAPNAAVIRLDADNQDQVAELVKSHDLAVSLLPFRFHPMVARICLAHKTHMVTASYASDDIRAMDEAAKAAGITLLNEIGVDPGIDHMSAMRVIDKVHEQGGQIESFYSYCGGLPAPDANDNPFGYKFSWSPRGVLTAGTNDAQYLKDGKIVTINGKDLFSFSTGLSVDGFDGLETYPNRNSLPYIDIYGIPETQTLMRGTVRNMGWCDKLLALAKLGLLDDSHVDLPGTATFLDLMQQKTHAQPGEETLAKAAAMAGQAPGSPVMAGLEWLGLFDAVQLPKSRNILDIMTQLFYDKMQYRPGERDMILLHHDFVAAFDQGRKRITATLVEYGIENGDSAMARTVGLPAAIGVELILKGKIQLPGVQIPVIPGIYQPVLDRLEQLNIRCTETESPL